MNHGRAVAHLRITVVVAAHRIRFTPAGPLDAANAHLLTDAVRAGLARHSAAVCEIGAELVTELDQCGAAAITACRGEAERRGLVFVLTGPSARLTTLLDADQRRA